MKKVLGFLVLMFTMTSCYDDYVKDFTYDAVYFTYQLDVRTFVVGEGMKFDYGVGLGGVMTNDRTRIVEYKIDETLITPAILTSMKASSLSYIKDATSGVTALSLLPASYYSLTNANQFIIEKGQNTGRVTISLPDSGKLFLADAKSLTPNYVLPLVITSADADSIRTTKKYTVIGVKYENMLFGNYWHGGVTVEIKANGDTIKPITKYYTAIPSPETTVWALKTVAPYELTVNGYSGKNGAAKPQLKLLLNKDLSLKSNNITLTNVTGSDFPFMANGECSFNNSTLLQNRKIFLKYKYVNTAGNTCYATDTLTFRNRIRDGVNEWQDENPSHY